MKILVQILILILLFSCNENQSTNRKTEDLKAINKKNSVKPIEKDFKPDSSYLEDWCSVDILKQTSENLEKLNPPIVAEFLATFHKDCSNNVEYSEWSNELLFEVLIKKPDLLLQVLDENNSLDKDLIKSEFENPIHDGFDISGIINKVEISNSPKLIREEIIESLKKGKEKNK